MKITVLKVESDHELVLLGEDESAGYRGLIAIHSTRLGPAVGGTRVWRYSSQAAALTDVLRLSRGMTYKNAAAGLDLGGGKSVIMLDDGAVDRGSLFRAHGRFVEALSGRYITAEDVGSSPSDMALMREETRHVAGLVGLSGDPSPVTARGVFRAIQATMKHRHGDPGLAGKRVAIQGVGHVGYHLARELAAAGAELIVADLHPQAVERCIGEMGATAASPQSIHTIEAEVFAPCAMGGGLNAGTIGELRCAAVVGAANNQLEEESDGDRLEAREILYAPDYIANAGGVINGSREILGWSAERALARVEGIYDTVLEVFRAAAMNEITTARAADRLAERRLEQRQV